MSERKEWFKVSRGHNGITVVTVTVQDENITSRWSTRSYSTLASAVREARAKAGEHLDAMAEVVR